MITRFVGDVHGQFSRYMIKTYDVERSVQVGDMGVGFGQELPVLAPGHRWIRGNHDSPRAAKDHPRWIRDGTVEGDVMYIGGAWSIDHQWRTAGVNWWPDEELSLLDMYDVVTAAQTFHPRVLVTHDFPDRVKSELFGVSDIYPTRTGQALDQVLDFVHPDLWIGGHWHVNVDKPIGRTRFICLAELACIDLDV